MDLKLALLVNSRTFTVGFETGRLEEEEAEVVQLHARVGFRAEEPEIEEQGE